MTRKPEDIRTALDATLSGASHDPTLYNRVVNASKGDSPPVKRKLHVALIVTLILLTLSVTAVAAGLYIPSLQDFFDRGNNFEYIFGVPPQAIDESAIVVPIDQQHTCNLVNLQIQQMYLTDERLYFTVNYTPKEDNTILFDGHNTNVMLDGKEVHYWHLWDTDYNLLDIGTMRLDNPKANEPYRYVEHVSCYRDPETNAITNLYAFKYTEDELMLFTQPSGTLTFYFRVSNQRNHDGEWDTLVVDFKEMKIVEIPDVVLTHE